MAINFSFTMTPRDSKLLTLYTPERSCGFYFFWPASELLHAVLVSRPFDWFQKISGRWFHFFSAAFPLALYVRDYTLDSSWLFNKPRTTRHDFQTRRFSTDFRLTWGDVVARGVRFRNGRIPKLKSAPGDERMQHRSDKAQLKCDERPDALTRTQTSVTGRWFRVTNRRQLRTR